MRVIFVIKDRDRGKAAGGEGRRRKKGMREGRVQRKKKVMWVEIAHTYAHTGHVRVKVERNIKKHSAALEIHVI